MIPAICPAVTALVAVRIEIRTGRISTGKCGVTALVAVRIEMYSTR